MRGPKLGANVVKWLADSKRFQISMFFFQTYIFSDPLRFFRAFFGARFQAPLFAYPRAPGCSKMPHYAHSLLIKLFFGRKQQLKCAGEDLEK